MNILVTGSRGFVGTETCKLLEQNGHEVIHYDILDGLDILNIDDLREQAFEADRILHLAAIARFDECDDRPVLAYETNAYGSANVATVAKELGIPMVHASTGSVYMPITYEPPITEDFPIRGNSVYACSKCTGEIYVRDKVNPHIILRYAHLYGPEKRNAGLIGNFLNRVERGLRPMIYGGSQSSDFCYIKDVAQANVLALEAEWPAWNNTYNIGSGEEMTVEHAVAILKKVTGYDGSVEYAERRQVDSSRFVYDISKAREKLKYKPEYNFLKGIKQMKKEDAL